MNKRINRLLFYLFFSLIVGGVVGVIDAIFSLGLNRIGEIREIYFMKLIYFLPLIGVVIVIFYKKYGKNSSKGMGYVFEASEVSKTIIPKRLIPFSIVSTWLTHLFGGSAGREGVAVQIGATVANATGNLFEKKMNMDLESFKRILISSGISAGFAGLFGTPFAATIFSLEVLRMGSIEYNALFPSLTSAYVAYFISGLFNIKHFHYIVTEIPQKNIENIIRFLIASFSFAIVGYIFAVLLKKMKKSSYFSKISNEKKIFFGGIVLAILMIFLYKGRYSGLGTNLIEKAFLGGEIYPYDWFLKLILTCFTLAIGFQGGEVTPLFSIGATLGVTLAMLFGLPVQFLAAIGYCAVFASATNTFLACFLIGIEIFGYEMAGYLFIACAISYLFSGEISIYEAQRKNHLKI